LADAHRLQKLLQENFAGMNGGKIPHDNTSMIVDDFDITFKDTIVNRYGQ
jgi:hypothetical protein